MGIHSIEPAGRPLNLLVFGAGAIGTFIGGSLALHGQYVVFFDRPEVVGEIRRQGLSLDLDGRIHRLASPQVAASLQEALDQSPYDAAIFALKSNDTQSALEMMAPFARRLPPLVCLQNGVGNEPALAAILGADHVIPGSVTSAVGKQRAGEIVLERRRGVALAEGHRVASQLAAAMNQAGLNAHLYPSAAGMKWSKMLTNLLANASSAILEMTPAEIFAHPGLYRLELRQLRETLQVMAAQHIRAINLPGTPVSLLAFGVRFLPAAISRPFLARAVGGGRGGKMPSFYIDLHSGRGMSEVDYLNGAVVRFGKRMGIDTPVNRLLNETLLALTRGDIPLKEFSHQPEKLLKMASSEWRVAECERRNGKS